MNNLIETIKKIFAASINFIILNKKKIIKISLASIFVLILIIVIIKVFFNEDRKNTTKTQNEDTIELIDTKIIAPSKKIDPNSLWLLAEPVKLPPIQFSREQRKIWEKDEVDYWYTPPSKKAMKKLHNKNKELIDNLLEEAP